MKSPIQGLSVPHAAHREGRRLVGLPPHGTSAWGDTGHAQPGSPSLGKCREGGSTVEPFTSGICHSNTHTHTESYSQLQGSQERSYHSSQDGPQGEGAESGSSLNQERHVLTSLPGLKGRTNACCRQRRKSTHQIHTSNELWCKNQRGPPVLRAI